MFLVVKVSTGRGYVMKTLKQPNNTPESNYVLFFQGKTVN